MRHGGASRAGEPRLRLRSRRCPSRSDDARPYSPGACPRWRRKKTSAIAAIGPSAWKVSAEGALEDGEHLTIRGQGTKSGSCQAAGRYDAGMRAPTWLVLFASLVAGCGAPGGSAGATSHDPEQNEG